MSVRLEQLLSLEQQTPQEPFIWFALAKEYEKRGEGERALAYYERLIRERPDYVGTYYHLGKWYERNLQLDKALETYTAGIAIAQAAGDRHAWSELAEAKMGIE